MAFSAKLKSPPVSFPPTAPRAGQASPRTSRKSADTVGEEKTQENIGSLLLNLAHQGELAKKVTTDGPTPGVPTAAALPVDVADPENDDSSSSQVKEVVYTTTKTGKNPREEYQPPVHKTKSFSSSEAKSSDNDSECIEKRMIWKANRILIKMRKTTTKKPENWKTKTKKQAAMVNRCRPSKPTCRYFSGYNSSMI